MGNGERIHQGANRAIQAAGGEGAVEPGRPQGPEGIIAGQKLITAIAAERHRYSLARKLGDQRGWKNRTVADNFVEPVRCVRGPVQAALDRKDFFVVYGLGGPGTEPGEFAFIERSLLKADAEGLDRRMVFPRQGCDQG